MRSGYTLRRYLEALPSGHVFVKLDFTNASNSLHNNNNNVRLLHC